MSFIPPLQFAFVFAALAVASVFAVSLAIVGRGRRLLWSCIALPAVAAWLALGHWLQQVLSAGKSVYEGSFAGTIEFWFWVALPLLLSIGARLLKRAPEIQGENNGAT
jgi:hypothetical protein